MPKVAIEEQGCRGCSMCVDVCPVQVFDLDSAKNLAKVSRTEDCIGCLSCFYDCPAQCVSVSEVELLRPFHRIEESVAFMEHFLQAKSATRTLSAQDCEEAYKDVSVRLKALAGAVTETMGRGQKAVGRKAGMVAASHLPEMYEEVGPEQVLKRMQERFKNSFTFDFKVSPGTYEMTFHPCGLAKVVESLGEKVGEAVLCQLFHEYWAGLLSSFTETKCQVEVGKSSASTCEMKIATS